MRGVQGGRCFAKRRQTSTWDPVSLGVGAWARPVHLSGIEGQLINQSVVGVGRWEVGTASGCSDCLLHVPRGDVKGIGRRMCLEDVQVITPLDNRLRTDWEGHDQATPRVRKAAPRV